MVNELREAFKRNSRDEQLQWQYDIWHRAIVTEIITLAFGRKSFSQAEIRGLHQSLARVGLNNFRRNLHAFLLSPFKSQDDEVEQEVPSRSLRTVYSAVSCTAIAYNFLFVAKIVCLVRSRLSNRPLLLSPIKRSSQKITDRAAFVAFPYPTRFCTSKYSRR